MRIVQACPYDWNAPGGVQTHVRQLASELRGRGHEVLVVAPGRGPAEDGVRLVGRPVRVPYQGTVAPISPWPATAVRTRRAVSWFRPDVVHAHEPLSPSVGMFAAWRSGVPVVGTFHAFSERSRMFDVAAPTVRPLWRRLAARVAVSEAAADFVRSRLHGRVVVVPNGLDVDAFASAEPAQGLPEGRRVLWVGRLDPQKGFAIALRAFELVAAELPDALLVVAGDGRDRAEVEALPPGVRDRAVMLGAVAHEVLPRYHAACEVYMSPAIGQESFGYVLVEAMAAGVPVVASDIPGYREVDRDGENGLLVPPRDPVALAGALLRVLGDPGLAARLGAAGRESAAAFSWDRVAGRIESIYTTVTSAH